MDFPAPERSRSSHRRRWLVILLTLTAAVFTAIAGAGNAAAAGNGANSWGDNEGAQLGHGPSVKRNDSFPAPVSALSEVTDVSAGDNFGLALLGNGTVKSWGESGEGQLGNGIEAMGFAPQTVCAVGAAPPCSPEQGTEKGNALTEVQEVSAGNSYALAVLKSGKVVAWGDNNDGQLGIGSTEKESSDVPVEVKGLPETEKFKAVAVAAGGMHALALMENEKQQTKVMAWGFNEYAQLGKEGGEKGGPTKCGAGELAAPCSLSPVEVQGVTAGTEKVTAISAGLNFSMALTSNGKVKSWGSEQAGELGNGVKHRECKAGEEACLKEKVFSATPVEPTGISGVEQISAGAEGAVVNLKSGGPKAWGADDVGELGNGSETTSATPVPVSGLTEKVAAIASGGNHSLVLLNNAEKTVMAWGGNANGQLGDGTTEGPEKCAEGKAPCSKTPIAVGDGLGQVAGISAGKEFSLSFGAPAPTVTEVKPHIGPEAGGAEVTITGTNFTGATAVKFGTSEATEKEITTEKIKAKSAACKGTVHVTVTTPALISRTSERDEFVCRAAGLNPTKWKANGVALTTAPSPVYGLGTLTLENSANKSETIGKVTCHTLLGASLFNEGESGLGSIEGFGTTPFTCTKAPTACPKAYLTAEPRLPEKPVEVQDGTEKVLVGKRAPSTLPWHTELLEVETEKVKSLVEKISKISLTLVDPCPPAPFEYEFFGTLEPKIVNGTKNGLSPTKLVFEGKGGHTGHLTGNVFAIEQSEKEAFLSGEVPAIGLGGNNALIQGQ